MTPAELDAILELGDPAVVVVEPDGPVADRAGAVTVIGLGDGQPDTDLEPRIAPSWKAPISGGSTGRPKIIMSGRPAVTSGSDPGMWGIERGEQALITAPLHHNAPFATALSTIFLGGSVILLTRLNAERTLSAIDAYGVTWVYLVPTMMRRILALPDEVRSRYPLESLRSAWHCAEPCPTWLKRRWIEWLGPERLWELYAGTEAEAGCTIRGDEWLAHVGSVGQVTWGEMKLLDPDGAEITEPDVAGEIFMRVTPGTDATYHYIGAEPHIRDGWSSLGDMGRFDADGYLYLHDRRSDMITVGGVNVYPAEIEAALVEHERVLTAVVIGLPNADTGNHLHAIVHTPNPAVPPRPSCAASSPIGSRATSSPRPSNWSISPCATPPARSGGRRCAPHASRRNPGERTIRSVRRLPGKKVLVTGGARGIGRMIAEGLLLRARAPSSTSPPWKADAADEAARSLSEFGEIHAFAADIATEQGCRDLIDAVAERTDHLDVLVNNAGATWGAPFDEFPDAAWDKVLGVNVKTPFTLAKLARPLLEAGAAAGDAPARIINIGSIDGLAVPNYENYSYSAAKAAIHHLTRHMAANLGTVDPGQRDRAGTVPDQDDEAGARRAGRRDRRRQSAAADRAPGGHHRRRDLPALSGRFVHHRHRHPGRRRAHRDHVRRPRSELPGGLNHA
ncbi:2-succinylbenzoate--CoA ligase [Streptomyces hirsutus]